MGKAKIDESDILRFLENLASCKRSLLERNGVYITEITISRDLYNQLKTMEVPMSKSKNMEIFQIMGIELKVK